jgi:hypothetical protein
VKKFLSIFIILWAILSFFYVFYNILKFTTEAKTWLPLSDYQKRQKIFGNIYDFLFFVQSNTEEKSSVLIFAKNDLASLLGRYYLYPRSIEVVSNLSSFQLVKSQKKFNYTAFFNSSVKKENCHLINSYYLGKLDYGSICKEK